MTHTRYTDPSGYDDASASTAADQVRLVDRAMRLPVFESIVATPSATLPVAGTVLLLGYDGFVGVKTGSTDAAGGCFAFRAIRWIDGKRTTITGVVLGQTGHNKTVAALAAADAWSTASPAIHGAKYALSHLVPLVRAGARFANRHPPSPFSAHPRVGDFREHGGDSGRPEDRSACCPLLPVWGRSIWSQPTATVFAAP